MGCTVTVMHHRLYKVPVLGGVAPILEPFDAPGGIKPDPCGGMTEVIITTPSNAVFRGFAYCSKHDNYCKRTGVKLCLDRLKNDYQSRLRTGGRFETCQTNRLASMYITRSCGVHR